MLVPLYAGLVLVLHISTLAIADYALGTVRSNCTSLALLDLKRQPSACFGVARTATATCRLRWPPARANCSGKQRFTLERCVVSRSSTSSPCYGCMRIALCSSTSLARRARARAGSQLRRGPASPQPPGSRPRARRSDPLERQPRPAPPLARRSILVPLRGALPSPHSCSAAVLSSEALARR